MELTRQEIITLINALLPSNANELVTASNLRQVINILNTSFYNKNDDNLNNNVSVPTWNNTLSYSQGFIVTYADKFWRSLQNANIGNIPNENAFWTEVSKATASQNIDLSQFYLKTELQTAGQALIALANVFGLQTALDNKANTSHTHAISNVTGLQTVLDLKASKPVPNSELAQMPANTVKANETNVSANPQDVVLLPFISGEATLVSGSRTIADSRVSASSVVLVTASTVGTLGQEIRYTKNNGVGVDFIANGSATATFSYLIIF